MSSLACIGVLAMTPPVRSQSSAKKDPDCAAVVKGNNAFAVDLYQQLRTPDGNLFFSPYSISTALAMTYDGARGQTAEEMAKTLHFALDQDKLHPAFAALIRATTGAGKPREYELTVANRLWGQKGLGFRPDFLKLTQDQYGAGLAEVDFYQAAEQARQTINAWVEQQTKKKIVELLKPGVVDDSTSLVLTNAIYFKAAWAHVLDKKATRPGDFRLPGNKTIQVPLMEGSVPAAVYDGGSFTVLDLPYAQHDLSMVLLLPKAVDGLPALEKSLTASNLSSWLSKIQRAQVALTLPKFKVTSEFRLNKELMALGMPTAFTPAADFSGMTSQERLYIGLVIHKAFVDVHEEGTEAAAATAVVMKRLAMEVLPAATFRADHPFVFLIRDNTTGSILFMGRVAQP
jgi:serine protease inhibitor